MRSILDRRDLILLLAAIVGAALFLVVVDDLWPFAEIEPFPPAERIEREAHELVERLGFSVDGHESNLTLVHEPAALDYLEHTFGLEFAQRWIADGQGLYYHRVIFKRAGTPGSFRVRIHPAHGVVGWRFELPDDASAERLPREEARERLWATLGEQLGLALADWEEVDSGIVELPDRVDREFHYERLVSEDPLFKQQLLTTMAGERVTRALRVPVVPPGAQARMVRGRTAEWALRWFGYGLLGAVLLGATAVFWRGLREHRVRLGEVLPWAGLVVALIVLMNLVLTDTFFWRWEPTGSRLISGVVTVARESALVLPISLVVIVLMGAALATERAGGHGRGESLRAFLKLRWTDPGVAAASLRAVLIGLICGGLFALLATILDATVGTRSVIQPRGFFFYGINTASAAVSLLSYFFVVVLVEETAHRYFSTSWLLNRTGNRWVAIVVPSVIYGISHTGVSFLPLHDPFWARAAVMSLIGLAWGWAYLRYDALTVLLSHLVADMYIFNQPRLGSGDPWLVAGAIAVIAAPVLPALIWLVAGRKPQAGHA